MFTALNVTLWEQEKRCVARSMVDQVKRSFVLDTRTMPDTDISRPHLIRDGTFLEDDWREIAQRRRASSSSVRRRPGVSAVAPGGSAGAPPIATHFVSNFPNHSTNRVLEFPPTIPTCRGFKLQTTGSLHMTIKPPDQGFIFWPVGTGDSTTVRVAQTVYLQVDLKPTRDHYPQR